MAVVSTPKLLGQGLGDPVLLNKIDRLLACNLSEYVNLPQLVVVGDQFSGKSSVLEGLTKLPFPRDSGLCTRFATHIIFRRTRADTKRSGAEENVIDLVEGKTPSLKLGWIVSRSNSSAKITHGMDLPRDKVGIAGLKIRLQDVQTTQIRRQFPKACHMRTEVGQKLKAMEQDLYALGTERGNPERQRSFILDIVTKFQDIVSQAMATSYGTHELFERYPDARLATIVRNRMDIFKSDMENDGNNNGNGDGEDDGRVDEVPVRKNMNASDHCGAIDGTLFEQEHMKKPTGDSILSGKWTELALGYVSDVIDIMHTFILEVLLFICPEEQIRDKLVSVPVDELSKRYREAMDQTRMVLDVERMNLMTLDNKFQETLEMTQKRSHREQYEIIKGMSKAPMSNTQRTIRYIHDILAAYYAVASRRFVDNICMQATGCCLLTGPRKPLGLSSPQFVADLTEDQLADIAGENAALSRRRTQLKKGIQDLETGRKITM
ncbi:uncharacterized protein N7500_006029 [Penicillium coprophilum]|uniref:uncharacterized protein n=1 Tax=Penicillium coprophilum TaxID=36646 RepID=UPI00239FEA47|nr:uncharacterized protein N7500_006029 [Penicillium coprophilum]KAJ5164199.1 hypothetical protein N7500_006029 [Penicillium coprophilum]